MSSARSLRRWYLVHKWSSLVCTGFLFVLCLTGLPLIFAVEIEQWQANAPERSALRTGELTGIDAMVSDARRRYPRDIVRFVFIDSDEASVTVVAGPADSADRRRDHEMVFDARSGALLSDALPADRTRPEVMSVVQRLHTDLYAGSAGEWLLAGVGILFVVAMVSGAVLYAPFMKKLEFGAVRRRSRRLKWLDVHDLLGICMLAWALVVGATGVLNELSKPLSAQWRTAQMHARLGGDAATPVAAPASAQAAYETVSRALPARNVTSIIFPSRSFSNPRHYMVWTNGSSPLTYRLFTAAWVDAQSGELAAVASMPLHLQIVQLSRPLHFGDYGGLPLKLVWAALDGLAIVLLGSGLYLWLARRDAEASRFARLARAHRS